MIDLSHKTVLITGASSGIGAETACALGKTGARVVAHHRNDADREGAEHAVRGVAPARRCLIAADLLHAEAVLRLWDDAVAWAGRIDVVVLNAGIFLEGGVDDEDAAWDHSWDAQMRVNTLAPARLMRRAVRHWQGDGRGGTLITFSSWSGQRGASNPRHIAYAATKSAVKAVAQSMAAAHAREGVLSYTLTPGIVRTSMSEQAAALLPGGEASITASLAMREWVPPAEIGALIAFLATGRARHLSGATLDINGASYLR